MSGVGNKLKFSLFSKTADFASELPNDARQAQSIVIQSVEELVPNCRSDISAPNALEEIDFSSDENDMSFEDSTQTVARYNACGDEIRDFDCDKNKSTVLQNGCDEYISDVLTAEVSSASPMSFRHAARTTILQSDSTEASSEDSAKNNPIEITKNLENSRSVDG